MKNKLLQFIILLFLSSLSFADITQLTEDSSDACEKFNQPGSVTVVHVAGCPWSAAYMKAVSNVANEPAYNKEWRYYELTFSKKEGDLEKVICNKTISGCPVTFIKNKKGKDFGPLHIEGAGAEEELKKALDEASADH